MEAALVPLTEASKHKLKTVSWIQLLNFYKEYYGYANAMRAKWSDYAFCSDFTRMHGKMR